MLAAVIRGSFALALALALPLALVLIVACDKSKSTDDCERAFARLARISKSKAERTPSKAANEQMLEDCRAGRSAYDPVLRCAMDSSTDAAAAECIDRGIKEVLGGSAGSSGGGGSGINPLLE